MSLKLYKSIVLLLLFSTICFSQTTETINPNGFNKFYHANGVVSSEGNMVNGKPDGVWKSYFDTGVLKSEGNRINGKLEGIWSFYNEDGIIAAE
jgi:antitoxin component YwqK of YwqJK toxin-antitoxin module